MKNKIYRVILLSLIASLSLSLFAQATPGKRVALVIGNGTYAVSPLTTPVNDAIDMAASFKRLGFTVTLKTDLTGRSMNETLDAFYADAAGAELVFFYYSGHGAQAPGPMGNENYLLPIDIAKAGGTPTESIIKYEGVPLGRISDELKGVRAKSCVFIVDACRSYPVTRQGKSSLDGLTGLKAPEGTLAMFATEEGQVALSGSGRNSVFTTSLLKRIETPGISLTDLAAHVRSDVYEATDGMQVPSLLDKMIGIVYLKPETEAKSKVQSETLKPQITAVNSFGSVELKVSLGGRLFMDGTELGSVDAGTFRLDQVPSGERSFTLNYADGTSENIKIVVPPNANAQISFSRKPEEKPSLSSSTMITPALNVEKAPPGNFVRIPGGTFTMGSPSSQAGHLLDQVQHKVTVSSFYMSKYEITQAEWSGVMGNNPSNFKGDSLPVEIVSWYDAILYCNKRSIKEGRTPCYSINGSSVPSQWGSIPASDNSALWDAVVCNFNANGYRLPTEAEWEYACRAGTNTPFYTGNNITTTQANYNGDYPYNGNEKGENRAKTLSVGSFAPNAYDLYDMHGNVWEWCWDWYGPYANGLLTDPIGATSGTKRVGRGGGWGYTAAGCTVTYRGNYVPNIHNIYIGFRLVYRP